MIHSGKSNLDISLSTVRRLVRDIPDFPKKGILFKDITPALAEPGVLTFLCQELAKPFLREGITKVLAIESRGFFFGTGVARELNAGLVPVRKAGKLPWNTIQESYTLEYGEAVLEIHQDALSTQDRVLLVDDVLATGGTLLATRRLVERLGAQVIGASCFLDIEFLKGKAALSPTQVCSLWSV